MFKKIGIVTALSTALLFTGAFSSQADAQTNQGQLNGSNYKVFYSINSINGNIGSPEDIQNLMDKFLQNFQDGSGKQKVENDEQKAQKQDQNKQEQKAQKQKQEKNEQKAQKQEQANNEEKANEQKANQNEKAQAKQPQPEQQTTQKEQAPAPEKANQTQQPETNQAPKQEQTAKQSQQLNQFEQEVVELTNQERAKNGLDPLKVDVELSKVAREKSADMARNDYFSHNSPTYGSPFDMMKQYGISYRTAGENIAKGQRTPEEVVNGWMNSQGHRENILNAEFTHIGVGYVEDGHVWTQQFIGK